jgi:phosphohistidine swiveling domain-containing protein
MLTPQQQQEMINIAKMIDQLYLWSGSLDEFTPTPTPSTYSFFLEKINNQRVMDRAMKLTTLPLFTPNEPYLVNVFDHAYVNMHYEKELFLGDSKVTFEVPNAHMRPEMNLSWTVTSLLPNVYILGRQISWILSFILTKKHTRICKKLWDETEKTANHIVGLDKIEDIEKDIEDLVSCVLGIELIDNLLEQYVREEVKPKYLYSWDIIEAYYWQRFRPLDQYFQSSYCIGAVYAGIMKKEDYLREYGMRGVVDFELMSPRYAEIPDTIFAHTAHEEKETLSEKLVNVGAIKSIRPLDKSLLAAAWEVKAMRGTIRMKSLVGVTRLRAALLQLAKQHTISTDLIFFMTLDEIKKDPKEYIDLAAARKDAYAKNMEVKLPPLITRDVVVKMTAIHEKGEKAIGGAVSSGEVQGTILYVRTPEIDAKMLENKIVVFPDASPAFSMLYRHAKGIIFESGGAMSHGAIVAREYRIPAITLGGHELAWEENTSVNLNGTDGTLMIL